MVVNRIVSAVGTGSIAELRAFYADLFGLEAVMDHGWFMTLASGEAQPVQIGLAAEGGSATPSSTTSRANHGERGGSSSAIRRERC